MNRKHFQAIDKDHSGAIDKDHSGKIDYTEFCEIMQVDPSPQCEKLFQMFDKDKAG